MNSLFKKITLVSALFITVLTAANASGRREKLFKLIDDGSTKEIKSMLRENKDYANATKGSDKETLLMAALKEDRDIDVINILIKYGADPDKKDKNKRNAVSYAAQYSSHADVIEKVIKSGAFFDFSKRKRILRKDKNKKTAFDWARENANPDMALSVLNKFAQEPEEEIVISSDGEETSRNIENEDTEEDLPEGTPPVFMENKNDEIQENQGQAAENNVPPVYVEPETPSKTQENTAAEVIPAQVPVVSAPVVSATVTSVTDAVTTPAASVNTEETADEEPASPPELSETPALEEMPEPSAPVAVKSTSTPVPEVKPYNKTYLFDYADVESDDDPIIDDKNYDPDHIFIENADAKDLNGRTKLMKAAKAGDLQLLENLIFSNASLNLKDNDGWTALMFAARFSKDPKILVSLIKNGADVFAKNDYGVSALKLAAGFNKESRITAELLSKYKTADNDVRGAFIYAITSGASVSTLEVFWKKGLNINSLYDGKTPLMYAAENNKDTKIIAWLLNNGARVTYKSTEGKTAFDYAKQNKALPHDNNYWALNSNGAE